MASLAREGSSTAWIPEESETELTMFAGPLVWQFSVQFKVNLAAFVELISRLLCYLSNQRVDLVDPEVLDVELLEASKAIGLLSDST